MSDLAHWNLRAAWICAAAALPLWIVPFWGERVPKLVENALLFGAPGLPLLGVLLALAALGFTGPRAAAIAAAIVNGLLVAAFFVLIGPAFTA
jgi:hypothetical protein